MTIRIRNRFTEIALALLVFPGWSLAAAPGGGGGSPELDSRRLIAKAHYENDHFKPAAEEYRRCIQMAPDSAADQFNLGLVLMRAAKYDEALRALDKAGEIDPEMLATFFVRGIIYKRQTKFDLAIRELKHVVEHDPECPGGFYNLGVAYKYAQKYPEATAAMEHVVRMWPNHPSAHYQLITLARRMGDVEKAARHKEIFDRIKDTVDESEKTVEALERSKYSYIIEVPAHGRELTPAAKGNVRFVDASEDAGLAAQAAPPAPATPFAGTMNRADYNEATARARYVPAVGGSVVLADYDGDGDRDLYVVHCAPEEKGSGNRLFRNEGEGRFHDVTAAAGVGDTGAGQAAVFGDYDNDGHLDLYVANYGPNALYHNRGDGTFENVSARARVDEPQFGRAVAFVDYDHDNDLDLFVGNGPSLSEPPEREQFVLPDDFPGQVNTLLRNNGNGTFSDLTDEAGLLLDEAQTRTVVFADFDTDFDTDLFVVNGNAPSLLFANVRMGRFVSGGTFSPPVTEGIDVAVEGDFNRDRKPDLLVATGKKLLLYLNAGDTKFVATPIELPAAMSDGVGRIGVFDSNNDGWPDLLLCDAAGRSLSLLAGTGPGVFRDITAGSGLDAAMGGIADLTVGDIDGDGDRDIVLYTRGRGAQLLRNDPADAGHWLTVQLVGKKTNRKGYGATVEIAAGGHYQKQTARQGRVHFGLGRLDTIDVVRVTWTNGVAQNVIRPAVDGVLTITEHVKVSASCGFLYAYNGRGFELINEILGVGPLGVPMAPGVYHQPDCTELTKIESHQLAERNGKYELRLTEELRETMYADRFTLRVVDRPAELEVIPNEMFSAPPFPEDKFFAVSDRRPPVAAVDDRGADVLKLIAARDGTYPTFPRTPHEGLAVPHSLTLDLGDLAGAGRIMLFLDGWIYWSESSTVMALAQDPRFALTPLSLEVPDRHGKWRTAIESVGLPTSKGLVVPVNLTGLFPTNDYRVRLSTTMCVYFDRIFVSTRDHADQCRVTELPVAEADLHYRGFSKMRRDALGFEYFDYAEASPSGSWSPPEGLFTRYGEVTELLQREDNMFVIFGPGDGLRMSFNAAALPPLPKKWERDFIFYANGWVKDGDLNTKFSETVTPLPFHGMSTYPYPESERYPQTAEHIRYRKTYNTRPSRRTVGQLPAWPH